MFCSGNTAIAFFCSAFATSPVLQPVSAHRRQYRDQHRQTSQQQPELPPAAGSAKCLARNPELRGMQPTPHLPGLVLTLQLLQVRLHLRGALVPLLAVFLHRLADDAFQFHRHLRIQLSRRNWLLVQYRIQRHQGILAR